MSTVMGISAIEREQERRRRVISEIKQAPIKLADCGADPHAVFYPLGRKALEGWGRPLNKEGDSGLD